MMSVDREYEDVMPYQRIEAGLPPVQVRKNEADYSWTMEDYDYYH